MDLYLIRHAIAFDRDPLRWPDDGERPLTPDGTKAFRKAARGLPEAIGDVDLVLSSPLLRARQTASIACKRADWPEPIVCEPLAQPSAVDTLEALREHASAASVALVGHEPHLHRLAGYLLTGDEEAVPFELKKGGAARITFAVGPQPGAGHLAWLLTPKLLRRLG